MRSVSHRLSNGTAESHSFDALCWDRNLNGLTDTDEDRDKNNQWNSADCHPSTISDLYVEFDAAAFIPVLEDASGNPQSPGSVVTTLAKDLKLDTVYTGGHAYVRVEVTSPLNATPMSPGPVAILTFTRVSPTGPLGPFVPYRRDGVDEVLVKDLTSSAPPTLLQAANLFERVEDATFSPGGDRLLLAAISNARPVLLRTTSLATAAGAIKILKTPTRVRGLDWEFQDRFLACNWIGGYQHPQNKAIISGLRGGMDDLKTWRGLRDPDAFRSEAERGHEFLDANGEDVASKLPTCSGSHQDCPDYHLCVDGKCKLVPCDPGNKYSCKDTGGRCTLRPLAVEQEFTGPKGADLFQWVCSADCDVDQQCFVEQCMNGPCRFCDATNLTCIECREAIKQLGELSISGIEGCPDERSFRCEAGDCVSDCYAIQDGESIYLCDAATEYCHYGNCVLHNWDWWDLAPAGFAGLGDMRQVVPPEAGLGGWHGYTQAVDQRIPVTVTAYGVSDFGAPPLLSVEVKGGSFYSSWQRVGEVSVHATTANDANQNPIGLIVPHPFTDLRLRLITSPYDNAAAAATGLGARDKDFCLADLNASKQAGETVDAAICDRRAQGSRYTIGYEADIAPGIAIAACKDHGGAGCPIASNGEHQYLHAGAPAAVVLDVQVKGASVMNAVTRDLVCAYGGYGADALLPTDGVNGPKKVFYGDIATERSPEKDAFCLANPTECASPGDYGLIDFPSESKGFGLLNCNVVDPAHQGEMAAMTFANIPIITEWPARDGAIVLDTGDVCTVEVTPFLNAPCYEWTGGDVSIDPMSGVASQGPGVVFGLLEFTWFRGFGHGEGFDAVKIGRYPIKVDVTGYGAGTNVLSVSCPGGIVSASGSAATQTLNCPGDVPLGYAWDLLILTQPSVDLVCAFEPGGALDAHGTMDPGGATAKIVCSAAKIVKGSVTGLDAGKLTLEARLSENGADVSTIKDVIRTASGPFDIAALPVGGSYAVKVKIQPEGKRCIIQGGSGTLTASSNTNVAVTCTAATARKLSVVVAGLDGTVTGLEVTEAASELTLAPDKDGKTDFATPFTADDTYELAITGQPDDYVCEITDGGSGIMPDADTTGATITCTQLDHYTVGGKVVGLGGVGLKLKLNGGSEITIAKPPSGTTQPTLFSFPTATLVSGKTYKVEISAQPLTPTQSCEVVAGEGVIADKAPEYITVICKLVVSNEAYALGGIVSGLSGTGLKLKLNGGVQKVDISAGGPWTFGNPVGTDTTYDVTVDRYPDSPTQICTITNGKGTMKKAPLNNVNVSCQDAATVTVEVNKPEAEGASVKAVLASFGASGKILAVSPEKLKIKNGTVVFEMRSPGDLDETARLATGSYDLFVYINQDNDYDGSGAPNFDAGDPAVHKVIVPSPTNTAPIVLNASAFAPALLAHVNLGGPTTVTKSVQCFWDSSTGPVSLPPPISSPVIARTIYGCTPKTGETTCELSKLVRTAGAVPKILVGNAEKPWDVTCWIDTNEDGQVNTGDYKGRYSWLSTTTTTLTLTVQ